MAQLNKPDLITLMNDNLPDNTEQEITAEKLREVLESMIESDTNPNDIGIESFTTTDQDNLTDAVIALLLLTNFPAYAELFMTAAGTQNIDGAGEALIFNTEGAVKLLEYDSTTAIKITANTGPEEFNLRFEGSVIAANTTGFDIFARVNASNVRQLGSLMPATNEVASFSFGAFLVLEDNDLVEIFVVPDAVNRDFLLQPGARFTIQRI